MNLNDLYPWFVFAHILGAFVFAASHGVSAWLTNEIGKEREAAKISAILTLSGRSLAGVYVGLLVLLIGGVGAGIIGGLFGRLWIWISLGLLIAIAVAMYIVATPYFRGLRAAIGAPTRDDPGTGTMTVSQDELEAMVARNPAAALAGIGLTGFMIILWLMVFKPF